MVTVGRRHHPSLGWCWRLLLGGLLGQLALLHFLYVHVEHLSQEELNVVPSLAASSTSSRKPTASVIRSKSTTLNRSNPSAVIQKSTMTLLAPTTNAMFNGHRKLAVHNPWSKPRYVCDTEIPAKETAEVEVGSDIDECPIDDDNNVMARIFPFDPSLRGEGMPPKVLRFQKNDPEQNPLEKVDCDVPCSVWPYTIPTVRNMATIDGTPFQLVPYSMEGSAYYQSLEVDPRAHLHHQICATTSFRSDIPLSYYDPTSQDIQYPSVDFDKAIKGAVFLANNCNSLSGRENLVKELIHEVQARQNTTTTDNAVVTRDVDVDAKAAFRIDSLSSCLRNALPPNGINLDNKTDVMSSYLFYFAFENQRTEDYITEKLWGAYASGTLPVYLGAPNVLEHVPPQSLIRVDDFASAKDLVDFLIQVSHNRTSYESFHAWRQRPLPQTFRTKYEFAQVHSYCRICRLTYAQQYGLGWDHVKQQITPTRLARRACLDSEDGWMTQPIGEVWIGTEDGQPPLPIPLEQPVKCHSKTSRHPKAVVGTSLTRTIWDHDGVTDIEIHQNKTAALVTESVRLRLVVPINTTELLHQNPKRDYWRKVYWIQDNLSRVVIVFDQPIEMPTVLSAPGLVEVPIYAPLRIRLIVEDMDTFHEGSEAKESYFSRIMIDEFWHPMEVRVS